MSDRLSRRKLITRGLAAAAGASGLGVGARLADRYGLTPPDHRGDLRRGRNPDLCRPAAFSPTFAGPRVSPQHDLKGPLRERYPSFERCL